MFDRLGLFIDGQWRRTGSAGAGEDVVNPADESVLGRLPHAGDGDLDDAVAAARKGLEAWRKSSAEDRAGIMHRAADLLQQRAQDLSRFMTLEQGKPLAESAGEWARVLETLQWNADAALRIASKSYPARAGGLKQETRPEPVGICLALTAWNFPAVLAVRKLAPALAAGCSIILKAAEETPASAMALVEALHDAGLPPGVVNLVFGVPSDISANLIARPEIRKISFTGSVPVGQHLAALAAPGLKRCTLELGGHAPAIIFDDADVETAAATLAGFKFRNAGQVCIAPSRFYIQGSAYDRFRDAFVQHARQIVLGNGLSPDTTMGPMANARRVEAMAELKDDAITRGARVALEGGPVPNKGYFVAPMVLEDVTDEARIMREEPFGPIAPLSRFDERDEVLGRANALEYGLASYVFTGAQDTAEHMIARLDCGGVAINTVSPAQPETPFGGIKHSGYGYEGGEEAIDAYLAKKLVSIGR